MEEVKKDANVLVPLLMIAAGVGMGAGTNPVSKLVRPVVTPATLVGLATYPKASA